jgi:hypothetical protein
MLEVLIEILLFITNPLLSTFLLVFVYLYSHKERKSILVIVLFLCNSVAFNSLLKYYFKVPLDPSLKNSCWYAFPSGHLQQAILFWGIIWIKNNYRKDFLLYFSLALILAAWATNYRKYHTVIEMLGAIPPAILILLIYNAYKNISNLQFFTFFAAIFQLFVLAIIESPCANFHFTWLWLDLGFTLSILVLDRFKSLETSHEPGKSLAFALAFCYNLIFNFLLKNLATFDLQLLAGFVFFIILQSTIKIYDRFH